MIKRMGVVLAVLLSTGGTAWAWGQEGHSIVAEIAQRRLSPQAAAEVTRLLGTGVSLASAASWADDVRDERPQTFNWHFVDIHIADNTYNEAKDCHPDDEATKGDCIVAELTRLSSDLRCAPTDDKKRDALRFAVHFVGDIHQPLHTVFEAQGGNQIQVTMNMAGSLPCGRPPCKPKVQEMNFHAAWDSGLIMMTVFDWGAYVERLETGWLKTPAARQDGGSFVDWANATHADAQAVWNALPADRVLNDDYYKLALPVIDRQLGLAGVRLARLLNEAYASKTCPRQ